MKPIPLSERKPDPITCVLIWKETSLNWEYAYYFNNDEWLIYHNYKSYWIRDEPDMKILFWLPLPERPGIDSIKEEIKRSS